MRADQVFLGSVLSFIGGVASGSFFAVQDFFLLLLLASWTALLAVFPRKNILCFGIFVASWAGGSSAALHEREYFQMPHAFEKEVSGVARIVADPEEKDFFREAVLHFESCDGGIPCPRKDVLWQAPRTLALEAGERWRFSCLLKEPENFSPDFDYRMFLGKDGIGFVCEKASLAEKIPGQDMEGRLRSWLYAPKHALEHALGRSIAEPEAGLAKGLLLGGNAYLPVSLQDAFTRAGLSHIVAVSGYNITIIAQGFLLLGIAIGFWRKQAIRAALLGIVLFILMIGAPASASRAGAMAGAAFLAMQTGRLSPSLRALFFAAGAMLLWNPLLLRYDIGFQLSFLATLGIIVAASWQNSFWRGEFRGKWFAELAWMTFMAELCIVPLILYHFHTFSPFMLLANMLVLPAVPYAMGLSFAAAAAFLVFPGLHVLFAWAAYAALSFLTRSAEAIGGLPGAQIAVASFGIGALLLWYAALFFAIVGIERHRKRKIYAEAFSRSRSR